MTFGIKLTLVDQWQLVRKKWSFIFNSIATTLLGYLTIAPDAIIQVWTYLPDDIKGYVPVKFALFIPLALFILGLVSQFIKQQKLDALKAKDNGTL